MEEYQTPSHTQCFEIQIKKSRFATTIGNVQDKGQAKSFIVSIRSRYPDASHHCWAMVAGTPDDIHQHDQSDDGEPSGTAGRPMLHVLQHSGLGNVVVVVTRYFGGIKLGAGGLVRAYTRAVSEPLKELDTRTVRRGLPMTIRLPYPSLNKFEHWLDSHHTVIVEKTYSEWVLLELLVPESEKNLIIEKIRELG